MCRAFRIAWYFANKQKAEILVLECMAVNPELQYISEQHILEADVTVITNVREVYGKGFNYIK